VNSLPFFKEGMPQKSEGFFVAGVVKTHLGFYLHIQQQSFHKTLLVGLVVFI